MHYHTNLERETWVGLVHIMIGRLELKIQTVHYLRESLRLIETPSELRFRFRFRLDASTHLFLFSIASEKISRNCGDINKFIDFLETKEFELLVLCACS